MAIEQKTRLVIIVTDGPLFIGQPKSIAGRNVIHVPVASPRIPIATVATTIATGVNPNTHGIGAALTVDCETMQVRDTLASDRRFQAFWTESGRSGMKIELINWPATNGDPDVITNFPDDVFAKAETCLGNDILGFVLPTTLNETITEEFILSQERQLHSFLNRLSKETKVLIVHKMTDKNGKLSDDSHPLSAALLIEGVEFETNRATFLESIGGSVYLLADLPCPMGVRLPAWSFLDQELVRAKNRSFPIAVLSDATDWDLLITALKAKARDGCKESLKSISVLIHRFSTLMYCSYKSKHWKNLENNSLNLVQLRGKAVECWMNVISLHQQNKLEEAREIIGHMKQHFQNNAVTKIAESLQLIDGDQESVREKLQGIVPTKVAIQASLGTLGRLSLRVGLDDLGIRAIELALKTKNAIPADRAALAAFYFSKDEFESALSALGRVGLQGGEITWQSLRLKILVELEIKDESKLVAQRILKKQPNNVLALEILKNA